MSKPVRLRWATAAALLVPGLALAQGAGPGFSRVPEPSWVIISSFNAVPGKDIRQVAHWRLSNDLPGTWTTAVTAAGLPPYFGGDNTSLDVLIGTYDPRPGQAYFTPTLEAKPLNTTADEQNLMLDPSGLVAIFERTDTTGYGVYLATRTQVGQPFGNVRKVSGFGTLVGVNPSLGPVGGALRCFYTDRKSIWMSGIDVANAALTGSPVEVSRPVQPGSKPFAPTPLVGADGEVEGLFLAEEVSTADSDLVWANDLDPLTSAIVCVQRPDWTNHGGPAGGYLTFAHNILPRWHVMHSETAWLAGDVEPPGGNADLLLAGVNQSQPLVPLLSAVFLSVQPSIQIPIRGYNGVFALDLASVVFIGAAVHPDWSGVGTLSFPIPNDPGLRGLRVAAQGIVIDTVKKANTFTNTAWLRIQ
jgi:hypothetical protein